MTESLIEMYHMRVRINVAYELAEKIMHSPTRHSESVDRRLALLSDLKSRLESCQNSVFNNISFDHLRDLLHEADTMVQDDELSKQLVDLAALSFNNGPLLLEKVLDEEFKGVAERLIGEHFAFVAVGKFAWLEDLRMMNYSTTDMMSLVELAQRTSPWLTDDESHSEGEDAGALDTKLHQPHCVHTGGATLDQQQHLEVQTKVDWQQLTSDRNSMRKRVAAECGLGGVRHWKIGDSSTGEAVFDHTRASVSVYVSDVTTAEDEWFFDGKPRVTQNRPPGLVKLNRCQSKIIRSLEQATTRFCNAARVIQKSQSCCNSFTIVVSRKPTEQLSAVVDMLSISFRSLKAFKDSLSALTFHPSGQDGFVQQEKFQKCSAIGGRLLGIFGYAITSNEGLRDRDLQIISLAAQLLGFGLVSYAQGHLGPLSPFFLAEPLTEMRLLGIGSYSIYIKASLKDLACLGEMVGGRVLAFELMSTTKLSPDVLHLNRTNAVSPESFEAGPTSYALSYNPPLPRQTCELLARAVDIIDTWGPGLFISEPGAAYGKGLYAIEIGGGVLKIAESESKEVGSSRFTSFTPKPGLAYVKRLHDIAIEVGRSKSKPFTSQSEEKYFDLGGGETTWAGSEGEKQGVKVVGHSSHDTKAVYSESQQETDSGETKTKELRSTEGHLDMPMFHWSPKYGSYMELKTQPTFSCWDWLRIGALNTNLDCPLRPDECRKKSQQRLSNLGTEADFWELSERQAAFQAGYYTVFQVGNTYARKLGRTVKQQIIEQWSMFQDIHTLDVLWGLQVSLCTGLARRVSLLHLIQDSLLDHVNPLKHERWHKMVPEVRAAFRGCINIDYWIMGLDSEQKIDLIAIITYVLGLLRHTGLDRDGKSLSVLWPSRSNISYGIKIPCDRRTLWPRLMQDTESCATFAAVTSSCLEGHNHDCRNMNAPPWLEDTAFLSTAVCRDLTAMNSAPRAVDHWRLEDGKRYWIGKAGSGFWVLVRKNSKDEPQLFVRGNRFPKVLSLSYNVLKLDIIRERPDASFEAEEVIVF